MSTENFGILADDDHVVVTCPNAGEDVRVEIFIDELGTYCCRVHAYGGSTTKVIGRQQPE